MGCNTCAEETKPGEDFCWDCLGEEKPVLPSDPVINDIIYHTVATQPITYNGTITVPDKYIFTYQNTTGSLQNVTGIDYDGAVFFHPASYRFDAINTMPGDSIQFTVTLNVPTHTGTIV